MMPLLLEMLGNANFQWVAAGTFLLGASSGILGSFTLLRRRSLMADVLSHTALPGVALAFMLTQSKSVEPLLLGAVVAGLAGTWCVDVITRMSRLKEDAAQALALTVFFGFGIVLLTRIASSGAAAQSGLDRFLFGQAASLVGHDIKVIGGVAVALAVAVVLFFKEFKLLCFDAAFGRGIGLPMGFIDKMLMLLVVCVVAIGLQAVGVVLMAALLITPAAAARYWTDRLETMVLLAALFGGLSGIAGTVVSVTGARLATGPLIVLAATGLFAVSLAFGLRRGLVPKAWRQAKLRGKVARENFLRCLYEYWEMHRAGRVPSPASVPAAATTPVSTVPASAVPARTVPASTAAVSAPSATANETGAGAGEWRETAVPTADIARRLGWSGARTRWWVRAMARRGLLELGPGSLCRLTAAGWAEAQRIVRRHRLWELFLAHEADFAVDHVDRDADDVEHYLPAEVVEALERRLREAYGVHAFPESVHPLHDET